MNSIQMRRVHLLMSHLCPQPAACLRPVEASWNAGAEHVRSPKFSTRTDITGAAAAASTAGLASRSGFITCSATSATADATNKVCVVVGVNANPGVGQACAAKFASEGYKVAMLARSDLKELEKKIPNSKAFVCDVTKEASIKNALQAIESELGPVDVLMYNAGNMVWKRTLELTVDMLQTAFDINVKGLLLFSQALVPKMIARGSGSIGVTGATASWRGIANTPAFAAAKMGQRGLVQAMVRDFSPQGVHVFLMVLDGAVAGAGGPAPHKILPDDIAAAAYATAQQPPGAWQWEMHLFAAKQESIMTT